MSKTSFLRDFLSFGKKEVDVTMNEDIAKQESPEREMTSPDHTGVDEPRDRELEIKVIDKLREIFDPEIPVNIYELGLIYDIRADLDGNIKITMTLTTPHCPVAESMPSEVEMKARDVPGINDVKVDLVWDPPWDMTMMSEAARLEMGLM
jgi:FeS assembly SUF system protein